MEDFLWRQDFVELDQIDWACFQTAKLKAITANPMIDRRSVGVKSPVSGMGEADAVAVALGLAVVFGDAVGIGVVVWAEPEASKAGASPA